MKSWKSWNWAAATKRHKPEGAGLSTSGSKSKRDAKKASPWGEAFLYTIKIGAGRGSMNLIAHPAGTGLPHGFALGKALGDVQNALVGAAAKAQLQTQLLLPEGAIH